MRSEHIESAAELAREHGVPPKTFRDALRKAKRSGRLPWREAIDGTRYRVLRGSDAHKEMLVILRTLAGQARPEFVAMRNDAIFRTDQESGPSNNPGSH